MIVRHPLHVCARVVHRSVSGRRRQFGRVKPQNHRTRRRPFEGFGFVGSDLSGYGRIVSLGTEKEKEDE